MYQYFEHRGARFAYRDEGKGRAVVLIHGYLENQQMWHPLAPELKGRYRRLSLDLPGHGRSEDLGHVNTMAELAELLRDLLKHLRLRKVVLIGHSMGGYVALAFAEAYPYLVKAMILLNSSARPDDEERKLNRRRAIELMKRNFPRYVAQAIPNMFSEANRSLLHESVEALKKSALQTTLKGSIAAQEGMILRPDREVLLHFAGFPILFVASKEDPVIPESRSVEQTRDSRAELLLIEGGHFSLVENAGSVRTGVQNFLRRLK